MEPEPECHGRSVLPEPDGQAAVQSPAVQFPVSADLQPIVRLGVLTFEGLTVAAHDAAHGCAAGGGGSQRSALHPPEESAAVRAMYRRTGLDPTKRRPSSEALLRRVRKGEGLPRINSLVDVCNWCSLEFQLPYGLYDLDRIEGDVMLRLGEEGEAYAGIRKDEVHVAGRIDAGRCARAVRQSVLRLGAHDGDRGGHARADDRLCARGGAAAAARAGAAISSRARSRTAAVRRRRAA